MPPVELDNNAIDILNRIVLREQYETPSDAIRHLFNRHVIESAIIDKQDKEISKLEDCIRQLKG